MIAGNYFKAKSHANTAWLLCVWRDLIPAFEPSYYTLHSSSVECNDLQLSIYAHSLAVQSWMRFQIHLWLVP